MTDKSVNGREWKTSLCYGKQVAEACESFERGGFTIFALLPAPGRDGYDSVRIVAWRAR